MDYIVEVIVKVLFPIVSSYLFFAQVSNRGILCCEMHICVILLLKTLDS